MQTQKYCRQCGRTTLHRQASYSDVWQASAQQGCFIILTCGLWLPFAIYAAMQKQKEASKYRCQTCGRAN